MRGVERFLCRNPVQFRGSKGVVGWTARGGGAGWRGRGARGEGKVPKSRHLRINCFNTPISKVLIVDNEVGGAIPAGPGPMP